MIVLDSTTDSLQIVLGEAVTTNQLQCISSWRDITTTDYTPGKTVTNTNSTTDVNLVAAPWASTQRVIDTVSVYNSDTVNAWVTIKYDANWTEYILTRVSLGSGERLEYSEKKGWRVFNNLGSLKSFIVDSTPTNSAAISTVVLRSDVTNNNSIADSIIPVPWLELTLEQGKLYYIRAVINFTTAATTTGARIIFDVPLASYSTITSTNTHIGYHPTSTTANTITTGSIWTLWISTLPTTSAAINGNITVIEGFVSSRHKRFLQLYMSSEVSNSLVTVKAGSLIRFYEVV